MNNNTFRKAGKRLARIYYYFPIEAFIWLTILIALLIYDPAYDRHMSLCIFNRLGIDICPGCGLGRSIAFLIQGDLRNSLAMHPLGMPACLILSSRVINLFHNFFKNNKTRNLWQIS
ncbi:MAG TPA: DUF2752 domain-containing protein [Cyclobacteriaceae bacterium]|nr:DUF2752 domain-containing protein [Cyclobacteriaceae bacterium]